MRALIAAALLAPGLANADGLPARTDAFLYPIPDRAANLVFSYDAESLSGLLEFGLGTGRVEFGISNFFELPEYEPLGGVYLDEHSLLSEELSSFEVDTGTERFLSLTVSFTW